MSELDKITARFGRAYIRRKQAEESLKRQQKQLFEGFTKEISNHPLARKKVPYPVGEDLTDWVKKYHPGWKSHDATEDGAWLILQEDPAYVKFTHVNPITKMVYGRTVAEGSLSLDDEALKRDHPDLWEQITEWPQPWFSVIKQVIRDYSSLPCREYVIEQRAGKYLAQLGLERVLIDFNKLTDEDLMIVQDYLIPGPLTVKLVPPREAKPEELETVDEDNE